MLAFVFAALLHTLPACATEDAQGTCSWNASSQGNHTGTSFVVVNGETFMDPSPVRTPNYTCRCGERHTLTA